MRKRTALISGFGFFLAAVLVFAFFLWRNFQVVEVRGSSMLGTFEPGQRLIMSSAYALIGPVQREDIVVAKNPETGDVLIKRIKGMGGDVLDFALRPDNYNLAYGEYKVPAGMIYLVGDNREVSEDSRVLGPFPEDSVLGKIVRVDVLVYTSVAWIGTSLALAAIPALLARSSRGKSG
ncbi:MAG: hypothetical protein KIT11_02130 [Fimbriimonadaceae bacterium]|nr:hypothetical protein [Fimbriimonadaceae bacterium]QYK54831.1 MAG: hypothetical protein KF733_07405 [Fimbriimonadaceae bacterium]